MTVKNEKRSTAEEYSQKETQPQIAQRQFLFRKISMSHSPTTHHHSDRAHQGEQPQLTAISTNDPAGEPFCDFSKDFIDFIDPSPEQVSALIYYFPYFSDVDEHRHQLAYKQGGKRCGDLQQVSKIRNIGKEMIKDIGMKILQGNFSLTKISFPVRGMVPRTSLETATYGSCLFPLYMGLASRTLDPLEKMKLCVTALIAPNYYMNMFLKPLNPVIGQTLQATYSDGTQLYCQQISHHPPISYFLVLGPKRQYRYYGYYDYEAKAGLNSGKVINTGRRFIEFATGQKFQANFPNVQYEGVFLGTLRESTIGKFEIKEQKLGLSLKLPFGNVKKRPDDFFEGNIMHNGQAVASCRGTYLGFVNFDGKRYWDGRKVKPFRLQLTAHSKNDRATCLPSDSSHREDLQMLALGRMQQAQSAKQHVEQSQRKDTKLRKQAAKRRKHSQHHRHHAQ